MCKNIEIEEGIIGRTSGRKIKTVHKHAKGRALRQSDYSWHRSSYLCKTESNDASVNGNLRVGGSSSTESGKRVTFLCFGPPKSIQRRFEQLCQRWAWEQALREPYMIFQVVLEELYQQLHEMAIRLSDVFGDMEHVSLTLPSLMFPNCGLILRR